MLIDGIQNEDLNKIRSNAGDKKASGVAARKIAGRDLRDQISYPTRPWDFDHGTFYPLAVFDDLVFEQKLGSASQVVRRLWSIKT